MCRGKKMDIDITDAPTEQPMASDVVPCLCVTGDYRLGQVEQGVQQRGALAQMSQGKFAHDIRMGQDLSHLQQAG